MFTENVDNGTAVAYKCGNRPWANQREEKNHGIEESNQEAQKGEENRSDQAIDQNVRPAYRSGLEFLTDGLVCASLALFWQPNGVFSKDRPGCGFATSIGIRPRQQLPVTHAADVDMNKVGGAIVTDSAKLQPHSRIPHLRRGNARQANVNGFGLHVQAVEGNTGMRAT